MPRLPIDYTKAVIYKLVCRDPLVTEKYVGSTTDLTKRRSDHKSHCNNPNANNYNYFVYQFIRSHGGFENWEVVSIENVVDCLNSDMLRARERYWFESLHAELNKCVPTRTTKQWYEDNREHHLNKMKEWREVNREHILVKDKEFRENNQDNINEYQKKYRVLNRDALNEKQRERRELKKLKALGSITKKQLKDNSN